MTQLGQYLDQMRQRHPRLSMREMALEAGLSDNAVYKIIKQDRGARPETLKALADRWGDDDDYRALLRLAGHPVPEPVDDLDPQTREMLRQYDRLSPSDQARARAIVRALAEARIGYNDDPQTDDRPTTTQSAPATP